MQLTEIFCSIQGESTFAGFPCIFIRLAGCNLRCNYCDTTYSYSPEFTKSIKEIMAEIRQYEPVKLVEITGGEPLLQDDVYRLIQKLHNDAYKILLETNGSISLKKLPDLVIKIVDIKTPGSGSAESFLKENLNFISAEDEIKFVICNRDDYVWSKEFIRDHNLYNYKILFSAVAEQLKPKDLARWIIEDKLPVRLQLQLHKYIWNKNKKGV